MSLDSVDRYDVEAMIRDAVSQLRSEIESTARELREQIGAERVERQDADESLTRVINSRTEHLT